MSDITPTDRVLPAAIPLLGAAEATAALGASLRLRRDDTTIDSELSACLEAVLHTLGILDAIHVLDTDDTVALLGFVEGFLTQAADFVAHPDRSAWDHETQTSCSLKATQAHWSRRSYSASCCQP